jgi:hypothetical protein
MQPCFIHILCGLWRECNNFTIEILEKNNAKNKIQFISHLSETIHGIISHQEFLNFYLYITICKCTSNFPPQCLSFFLCWCDVIVWDIRMSRFLQSDR